MSEHMSGWSKDPKMAGWADEMHTWRGGLLMGTLLKAHLLAAPVLDLSGENYTPEIDIQLPFEHVDGSPVMVRIIVLATEPDAFGA
jgi:hypothetical protein